MRSEFLHIHDCERPLTIRNRYTGQALEVPCGHCPACQVHRITRLVPSILRESQCWKYVIFFTLTYKPKYRPYVYLPEYVVEDKYKQRFFDLRNHSQKYIDFCQGRIPVCSSVDVQRFVKRLRENIFRRFGLRGALRYCISGDYGSTTFLPHYHGILWFNDDRISASIEELVTTSWSLRLENGMSDQIGRIDVQHAYSAARYVACYTQTSDRRPPILDFRDFRPRCQHSSSPSLGSLVHPIESVEQIVTHGLTEVTFYDTETYGYRKQALSPSSVRRLFPTIPSFSSLHSYERYSLYRLCQAVLELPRQQRIAYFDDQFVINSFFADYVTLGFANITVHQRHDKYDRLYYAFKRLHYQAYSLNISLLDYDMLVSQFINNRKMKSFEKMYDYANKTPHPFVTVDVKRSQCDPYQIDHDYFVAMSNKFNKLIKRKCDNAYLERHPEYKQFHQ